LYILKILLTLRSIILDFRVLVTDSTSLLTGSTRYAILPRNPVGEYRYPREHRTN